MIQFFRLSTQKHRFMKTITLLMVVYAVLFFAVFFASLNLKQESNVFNVSQLHFESKSQERLEGLQRFFDSFKSPLIAIQENPVFQAYLENPEDNKTQLAELFVTLQKSLNCVSQLRFIDAQGNEKIKVLGPATRYTLPHVQNTHIISPTFLENVADKAFFQTLLGLGNGEVGLSKIANNEQYSAGKALQHPQVIYGLPIYVQGKLQGFLAVNVCLRDFFNLFAKTTLYEIFITDKNGEILLNPMDKHGLQKSRTQVEQLATTFGEEIATKILSNPRYYNDDLYAEHFNILNTNDDYVLILKAKFKDANQYSLQSVEAIGMSMLLALLLTIPIAFRLTSEQQQILQKLDEAVHIDDLTHLPNKTSLIENLNSHTQADLVLLSIDHFFDFTKVYGYQQIDEFLIHFANYLTKYSTVFEYTPYHLEKDQFVLALSPLSDIHLVEKLNAIKQTLEKQTLITSQKIELNITLSMGIAHYHKAQINSHDALLMAERSLLEARKMQYAFILPRQSPQKNPQNDHRNLWMLERIRNAANYNQVEVFYQPIQDSQTGKINKYEALMRLRDEDGTVIMPNDFISLSKATQFYPKLSQQLIRQVITRLKSLPSHVVISINLSMLDINHPEVMNTMIVEAAKYDVTHRIVIELVESEDLGDINEMLQIAKTLNNLGFKLAIDDFGSGYANFQNLIQLAPYFSFLKIDGSLIKPCLTDENYQRLVLSIHELATSLQMQTIAEFVENQESADLLSDLGIHYLQGYHIGKPEPQIRS